MCIVTDINDNDRIHYVIHESRTPVQFGRSVSCSLTLIAGDKNGRRWGKKMARTVYVQIFLFISEVVSALVTRIDLRHF